MGLKRFDTINVIPFIDIMLVLLVIVLTTASFMNEGIIPVDLPKANSDKKENKKREYSLSIKESGVLFFEKKQITFKELEGKVKELEKDSTILLRSDKKAHFQHFVMIMDMLKKHNRDQLYIVTKE